MKKLLFLLLFLPFLGNSQATFTAPVGYNTGVPSATPSGVGTRWRFDLLTGKKYTWLPGSLSWDEDARGIDQVSGCSAPLYTPGYNQSTFAVNSCAVPELYQWTGGVWVRLNEGDGNGIYGGSGTIPNGTIASIAESGVFSINYSTGSSAMIISEDEGIFSVSSLSGGAALGFEGNNFYLQGTGVLQFDAGNLGATYPIEYPDILTNDRSIPDVGLTKDLIASENDALGTGFTAGGGSGTIPSVTTATIGETQILFAVDAADQFKVISSPSSDPGATGFIEVVNGTVNFYANLGSVDKSVNMAAVGSGLSFTARNAGMDFTASGSEAIMSFISIPGNLVYDNTVETVKFTDNRATPIGIEYAADYSATIAANPRSIPDVGTVDLLKQTPVSYDNASAPNNCIFYSTTLSKLAYKDPGGTVNPLY